MVDLSTFDPNSVSNFNNNIFGLPTTEENAKLVILPVPWEVTVSYGSGTSRAPESIFNASFQVGIYDQEYTDCWQQGIYMSPIDKKILVKSNFLRKEAELYIDYISKGDDVAANKFMCKSLNDVNEGCEFLNNWVYENTKALLDKNKLVGVLGGDHSVALGFYKAIAEKHSDFGILQIDAHCDLLVAYESFIHSHASSMYNALNEVPEIKKLVQVGVRDYRNIEWDFIKNSQNRIVSFFESDIKARKYEGDTWSHITNEIVATLPQKVYISFDIDGLDRKLCPHTGTPVPGGFELDEIYFLFKKIIKSGRTIIGFDLCEVGVSDNDWNANVGARALFKLCNVTIASNQID